MYMLTAPILQGGPNPFVVAFGNAVVRPRLTVSRIQQVVAGYYGIDASYMKSAQRGRDVARPRQIAMFLAKELTPKSLPVIGREFRRDHTTVMYAIERVNHLRLIDGDIADDLTVLREKLAA